MPEEKNKVLLFLIRLYNVLLFGLGTTYRQRFKRYAEEAKMKQPEYPGETYMPEWRSQQQKEWNRLSVMLVLLATASSAVLALRDTAPKLAFSMWLSAAGLSICGLFALQYFSIKCLSMDHHTMTKLLQGESVVGTYFLAGAVASPVVMALWASILFVFGVIDYAVQVSLGGLTYTAFVLVPIGCAILCIAIIVLVGEVIDYQNRHEKRNGDSGRGQTHPYDVIQDASPDA